MVRKMNKTKKMLIWFSALLLIAGMLLFPACSGTENTDSSAAPDFSLNDLSGQPVSLSSLKGRTVLINFWTTTCPPCVAEMPHFQELQQDWAARDDVALLAINMGESAATVGTFIQKNNYSFPVLLDSQLNVSSKYKIRYTPTSILIGKDGQVKQKVIGPFKNKEAILKAIGEISG